jgi:MtrB/PioB family decaheme-associated outer membrane protein
MLNEEYKAFHTSVLRLAALFSLLCAAYSPGLMADYGIDSATLDSVDTSKWRCKFCPDEEGMRGSVEGSFGYSENGISQRFKNSEAEGEQGQLSLSGDILNTTATDQTNYVFDGLGNDNVRSAIDFKNYENLRAKVSISRSNHYFGEGALSIYPNPKAKELELPAAWLDQSSTAAMDFSTLYPVQNYRQRETLETQVQNSFGEQAWELSVHFRQQTRSGVGWTSGSILNDVIALPDARNDETRELTVKALMPFDFHRGSGNLGLEYFRSEYNNDRNSVSWENPFVAAIAGSDRGSLASSPDNQFQSWLFFAQYNLEKHRFELSYGQGRGEQDEQFLPYTNNTLLTTQTLPKNSYEGEIETQNTRLRWDYRVNPQWRLKTRYSFNQRDNVSEVLAYQPVFTDSLVQGVIENLRYSHKKSDLDITLDWRWRSQTRFGYSYEYQRLKRQKESAGEYDSSALSFYWKERWSPVFNTRAKIHIEERDEQKHKTENSLGDNSLYRDFSLADRLRNAAELDLDWQYTRNVQLSTKAVFRNDDFENTQVGVKESEEKSLGFNLNWQVNRYLTTSASLQRSWMTWMMAGSAQQSVPTWTSTQDDEYDVLTFGLRRSGINDDTVSVGMNYTYVTSQGETGLGADNQYDKLSSDSQTVLSYLSYQWRPEWQLRVETLYERYQSKNPALLAVNTLPRMIGNSIQDENYSNWLFGLRLKYQIPE